MESGNTILFITYTMKFPVVGGAFIRALRLAVEMSRRGWRPIICNSGPTLSDPKVRAAEGKVQFVRLIRDRPGLRVGTVRQEFLQLNPDVIVMGEGPIEPMRIFYDAARALGRPFIVLDQFYNHWLLPERHKVDLVLLYALASFWGNDLRLAPPYEITPPFIEDVVPKAALPVPRELHDRSWITAVAYDAYVLDKALELLARIDRPEAVKIVMCLNPERCKREAASLGINMETFIALPLQPDAVVFGFFGASRIALVSNGFLQIMEVLAMACPVVALERGSGVGMNELNIHSRFFRYVSFNESVGRQLDRIGSWFAEDVFSPDLRSRLTSERHGVIYCANRIQAVHTRYLWRKSRRNPWRRAVRFASRIANIGRVLREQSKS